MKLFRPILLVHHRRLRWGLRLLVLGLLVGLGAGHPWLAAWLIEQQLESAGGGREGGRSVDYERIVWEGVTWESEGFAVSVERLEVGLIPRMLATWFSPGEAAAQERYFVIASGVDLTIRETEDEDDVVADLPAWHDQAVELVQVAESWLPPIAVESLAVRASFVEGTIDSGRWNGTALTLNGVSLAAAESLPVSPSTAVLALDLLRQGSGLRLRLDGRLGPWEAFRADWRTASPPDRLRVDGDLTWTGGQLRGESIWEGTGWLPLEAELTGAVRDFGGTPLARPDLPEAAVAVNLRLENETLSVGLLGDGLWESPDPEIGRVPWEVAVDAAVTPSIIRLGSLEVRLPGLSARLRDTVAIDRQSLSPDAPAQLTWQADLGALPGISAQGRVGGTAELAPREPEGLHFRLIGQGEVDQLDLLPEAYRELGSLSFDFLGEASRERVRLEEAWLTTGRWGTVSGSGVWDAQAPRPVEASLEAEIQPLALESWLPADVVVGAPVGLVFQGAQINGAWEYAAELRAPQVAVKTLLELDLQAQARGDLERLSQWELIAQSTRNRLALGGTASWGGEDGQQLTLESLEERIDGEVRWELGAPAALRHVADAEGPRVTLSGLTLENRRQPGQLRLSAEGGSIEAWDAAVEVRSLDAAAVSGWYPLPNDQWRIESLNARARAAEGVLTGEVGLAASWRLRSGDFWRVRTTAELDDSELRLVEGWVSSPTADWLRASARLPLSLRHGTPEGWDVRISRTQPLRLDMRLDAREPLPSFFAERVPVEYQNVTASLLMDGPLEELRGQAYLNGTAISLLQAGAEPLILEQPELRATFGEGAIRIETVGFRLPEAPTRAYLSAAIEQVPWESLAAGETAEVLRQVEVTVSSQAFPLAALAPLLPDLVEPAGIVSARISKVGEADFSGRLSWEGINLRPLPNGAVPRNLRGSAELEGRRLEAIEAELTISGRRIGVGGMVDLEHWPEPLFNISIDAERIDLVRQIDLILRAAGHFDIVREDLDQPALISGDLTLADSLLLRDLRDFTRAGASGAGRRPPYFAVEAEPFADWRLDIGIEGDRFMRVQTPVFNGVISADFRLQGTLGDPVAVGQATIDDGAVLFPFGRIPLTSGRASISLSDPHSLYLDAQGRGVAFGYDVMLQLNGTAREPELVFSSPQGLAQDDIVLMLATGAVPAGGSSGSAARAGRIALFFGQDIFSTIFGRGSGASRFEVRSGEGLSPFRRSNQVIEYHFTDNWSAIGEADDFGDYNLDVKWNIYRK